MFLLLACVGDKVPPDSSSIHDSADCVAATFYEDLDADGYGGGSYEGCEGDEGLQLGGDCDDYEAAIHPEREESCNELDDDCDDNIDEGVTTTFYLDGDGDSFGGEETTEACSLPDGYVTEGGDCDDANLLAYPEAVEYCDEVDNDCDNAVDEGVQATYTPDGDDDGYGAIDGEVLEACFPPDGYGEPTDCNDAEKTAYPGATEDCSSGIDEDCDSLVSCEDGDCDGTEYCVETDCTDGIDNENDGYTDCEDDECWGETTCIDRVGTVVTSGSLLVSAETSWSSVYAYFTASSVAGLMRVYGEFGTASCTWSRPGTFYGYSYGSGLLISSTYGSVSMSSGCPVDSILWPQTITLGSTFGNLSHSQGVFLRLNSTAQFKSYSTANYRIRKAKGSLTTGDAYTSSYF